MNPCCIKSKKKKICTAKASRSAAFVTTGQKKERKKSKEGISTANNPHVPPAQ
jgi:hypothetical protein